MVYCCYSGPPRGFCPLQIYTTFYCRQNEPSYIKSLKLDILATIADETNAFEIATELTEYVNDIDEQLARDAVKAVGRIAIEASFCTHCKSGQLTLWIFLILQWLVITSATCKALAAPANHYKPSWLHTFSHSIKASHVSLWHTSEHL